MKKTVALAAASFAAIAGLAVGLGAGTANAMNLDECNAVAAQKMAEHRARQDPLSTHTSWSEYYCYVAHNDINGNPVYAIGIRGGFV
ncbi:hypothetical protein ACFVMC_01725 [Nocardia sp. NPDC127579]|uniref:hypothetical protein n=1 Tax=Nocardia sp. NPDC127579 TaxID=3345402 RepID=UPI003629A195